LATNSEDQCTLGIHVILTIQAIQVRVANGKMYASILVSPRLNPCLIANLGQGTVAGATTEDRSPPRLADQMLVQTVPRFCI
jgi:hypothetical protein